MSVLKKNFGCRQDAIITDCFVVMPDGVTDANGNRYYLHDCYPLQFINHEHTQANIKKNAAQRDTFTKYLENKGKLRK